MTIQKGIGLTDPRCEEKLDNFLQEFYKVHKKHNIEEAEAQKIFSALADYIDTVYVASFAEGYVNGLKRIYE